MHRNLSLLAVLVLVIAGVPLTHVRADIAPPKTPPGTTLLPGAETTQVRMLAETVTLTVLPDPSKPEAAIAKTEADFTMRNLDSSDEKMQVRFPLSFFDGSSNGFMEYPEIPSITVKVDGKGVPTHREMQPPFGEITTYTERQDIPWAVFDVAFPASQDVNVAVTYTVKSYGYYPHATFDYILETGAGWNGTIGSADIIVKLPYEANERNSLVQESALWDASTPGATLSGNEIRWHYADLEPTRENNIEVILITPSLWESVLKETGNVTRNPADGEAWGRLAKAYKEAARLPKGWLRDDPAGQELLPLSEAAYQKCLALLPKDPLWHYGYADLLWSEYYWEVRSSGKEDTQGLLPKTLAELQTTLALDPGNTLAKDLLEWIRVDVPGALQLDGDKYIFLGLTATPLPPTPYPEVPTQTPEVLPTNTSAPQMPTSIPTQLPPSQPASRSPLCGGAALILVLPGAAALWRRRRR